MRTITNKFGETLTIEIGEYYAFKSDIEQFGKVTNILGNSVTLSNEDGFEGGYIGGQTVTIVSIFDLSSD